MKINLKGGSVRECENEAGERFRCVGKGRERESEGKKVHNMFSLRVWAEVGGHGWCGSGII